MQKTAIILKKQWEDVLGIKCVVEASNWTEHFKKLTSKNFHVGGIHWISWFNDPLYTLQSFKDAKEKVNFTGWENQEFQKLLDQSDRTIDQEKRMDFLRQAEELITKDAVVLPIFYGQGWCVKQPHLVLNDSLVREHTDLSKLGMKKRDF